MPAASKFHLWPAVGFYGGGTQFVDVRDPRDLKAYGHAWWGASEVWDAMWLPRYNKAGQRTDDHTNIAYSIDLVRGLDVYEVDLPGRESTVRSGGTPSLAGLPVGVLAAAGVLALAIRRRGRGR